MERSMREIVSDILTWPWFSEPHGYNFNGHLVRDPGGNICIDPVEPPEDDTDALVREGVAWIILTNRNHSRRGEPGTGEHRRADGHSRRRRGPRPKPGDGTG